ncbi:MAG: prepilin-type N-terminal cleavage/methylation domain-containing protein, partial [Gemmatimonadetes bacterium]|nr:prepilin-type N-terminal cleavage/methylation domain-containing protein [Gemmatimonadota bacterium]
MSQLHPCRPRRSGGFTLVELLVSVGLTAVLMWGILQLYTSATRFSATMFTEAELVAGGRAALDRMSRELTSAATLDVGYIKMEFTPPDSNPVTFQPGTFDFIQFVAPVGTSGQLAHVCY